LWVSVELLVAWLGWFWVGWFRLAGLAWCGGGFGSWSCSFPVLEWARVELYFYHYGGFD